MQPAGELCSGAAVKSSGGVPQTGALCTAACSPAACRPAGSPPVVHFRDRSMVPSRGSDRPPSLGRPFSYVWLVSILATEYRRCRGFRGARQRVEPQLAEWQACKQRLAVCNFHTAGQCPVRQGQATSPILLEVSSQTDNRSCALQQHSSAPSCRCCCYQQE